MWQCRSHYHATFYECQEYTIQYEYDHVVDLIYYSVNLSPYLESIEYRLRLLDKATPITLWCVVN